MQNSDSTSTFVQDTTNSVNQKIYVRLGEPFAFITDAIQTMFKSALLAAAIASSLSWRWSSCSWCSTTKSRSSHPQS